MRQIYSFFLIGRVVFFNNLVRTKLFQHTFVRTLLFNLNLSLMKEESFFGGLLPSLIPSDENSLADNIGNGALVIAAIAALVTMPLVYSYFDSVIDDSFKVATFGNLTTGVATLLFEAAKFIAVHYAVAAVFTFGLNPKGRHAGRGGLVWLLILVGGAILYKSVTITAGQNQLIKEKAMTSTLAAAPFDESKYPQVAGIDSSLAKAYKAQDAAMTVRWKGVLVGAGQNLLSEANAQIGKLNADRNALVASLRAEHKQAQTATMGLFTSKLDALSSVGGYSEALYLLCLCVFASASSGYKRLRNGSHLPLAESGGRGGRYGYNRRNRRDATTDGAFDVAVEAEIKRRTAANFK
jgi:hypothetical protein